MFHKVIIFFILSTSILWSEVLPQSKKTVCLNMIVKDESDVITRCLSSVLPIIDYWVIVDTGSSDHTQQIINEYMKAKGVPGELHERPWVNFSHNRNEALVLAKNKGDYILIIDADEVLTYSKDYKLPELNKDCYLMETQYNGTIYSRNQLIKSQLNWMWIGAVHEMLVNSFIPVHDKLVGVINVVNTDGARARDPLRFLKDAKLLEESLLKTPNDPRTIFFLAQSYRDAGELDLALKYYEQYLTIGRSEQEIFWSLYQLALLHERLKKNQETIVKGYLRAITFRPSRIEPMFHLATYYRINGDIASAYRLATHALTLSPSTDDIQEKWIGDYGLLVEFSTIAFYAAKYEESLKACENLIANSHTPPLIKEEIQNNLPFIKLKMNPSTDEQSLP